MALQSPFRLGGRAALISSHGKIPPHFAGGSHPRNIGYSPTAKIPTLAVGSRAAAALRGETEPKFCPMGKTLRSKPPFGGEKRAPPRLRGRSFLAAELGFEPRHTESESAVLPLHNSAIRFSKRMILYHKLNDLSRCFLNFVFLPIFSFENDKKWEKYLDIY